MDVERRLGIAAPALLGIVIPVIPKNTASALSHGPRSCIQRILVVRGHTCMDGRLKVRRCLGLGVALEPPCQSGAVDAAVEAGVECF